MGTSCCPCNLNNVQKLLGSWGGKKFWNKPPKSSCMWVFLTDKIISIYTAPDWLYSSPSMLGYSHLSLAATAFWINTIWNLAKLTALNCFTLHYVIKSFTQWHWPNCKKFNILKEMSNNLLYLGYRLWCSFLQVFHFIFWYILWFLSFVMQTNYREKWQ